MIFLEAILETTHVLLTKDTFDVTDKIIRDSIYVSGENEMAFLSIPNESICFSNESNLSNNLIIKNFYVERRRWNFIAEVES